ncbi:hypothetical protein Hanom_Chr03g00197811 [Helianthus anomalus]
MYKIVILLQVQVLKQDIQECASQYNREIDLFLRRFRAKTEILKQDGLNAAFIIICYRHLFSFFVYGYNSHSGDYKTIHFSFSYSDGVVALAMIQTMTTDLKMKPRRIQRQHSSMLLFTFLSTDLGHQFVFNEWMMSLNVVRFHRRHWWQSCYLWAVDLVDMHLNGKNGDCVGSDEEPDWLRNSFGSKEVESPKKKVKVKERLGFISKQRDETEIEESFRDLGDGERLDDKELLVDEYESGDEKNGLCERKGGGVCCGWSSSDDEDEDKEFKIYFCSRTHLQLSQFVK